VADYFQALQYDEPRLALDLDDLQKRFYARSRELHPDRFARSSAAEQQAALDASSVLNDAYRTLRDPVQRAEYLLRQHGLAQAEQRAPADLLEEVFDLNIALDELQAGDESARPQVEASRAKFAAMRAQVDAELAQLFAEYDAARQPATLEKIQSQLNRRKYISNLIARAE
jgi:molecular chaperone HscB